tara:strand:- start:18765 stop:19040 length:276 start_codon:yes stop_codon:yes gene_type:complete
LAHIIKNNLKEIELLVFHDGRQWHAENNSTHFKASELVELEKKIETTFRKFLKKNKIEELRIFLRFDFNNFPKWLHQYHSHYFNRALTFSL